jgi:hypothetical protein
MDTMTVTIKIDPKVSIDYEFRITEKGVVVIGPPDKGVVYQAADTPAAAGHTTASIRELRRRLRQDSGGLQADVLDKMAANGGHIDRISVYDTIGRDTSKSLTGFTKPVGRVMTSMVDDGLLVKESADPLVPIYDHDNASFQKAQGFSMSPDLAKLWRIAVAGDSK